MVYQGGTFRSNNSWLVSEWESRLQAGLTGGGLVVGLTRLTSLSLLPATD